jgi:hypothetical protein
MTLVRRKALEISSWATWLASPGCKEWAEGLEREVAFIPSDWRALAWAIGSMRVVLDRRQAPIGSLAEVSAAAQKLVERVRLGGNIVVPLFQGPQYLWMFFLAKSWSERVGCGLVVFGSLLGGICLLMERRRLKPPYKDDVYDDDVACARFYRTELYRYTSWLWIQTSVVLSYWAGIDLAMHCGVRCRLVLSGVTVLAWMVLLPAMFQARRNNERRIEQLDALLAENDGATNSGAESR